jgi:hypothetical protein
MTGNTESSMGSDNVFIGRVPHRSGSGNVVIDATDAFGHTILNRGGTAVGRGATADESSIAIGAYAMAGRGLLPRLQELEEMFRQAGDMQTAQATLDLIAELELPERDAGIVKRLWEMIERAATASEVVMLVSNTAPLIAAIVPHH